MGHLWCSMDQNWDRFGAASIILCGQLIGDMSLSPRRPSNIVWRVPLEATYSTFVSFYRVRSRSATGTPFHLFGRKPTPAWQFRVAGRTTTTQRCTPQPPPPMATGPDRSRSLLPRPHLPQAPPQKRIRDVCTVQSRGGGFGVVHQGKTIPSGVAPLPSMHAEAAYTDADCWYRNSRST